MRIFLIPLSITFLNPKILGYLFSKPGENNVKNLTSENRRKLIRKASHCTWKNGHRQEVENFRQYLLGRTAILQKTVVGCPWTVLRLFCYCQNHGFGSPREPHQLPSWILHLVAFTKNLKLFCCSVSWREPFSKIRVFILATERNQLRIRSVHFDPLPLGVCFIGTHFVKI